MNTAFDKETKTTGTIPEIAKRFKARKQPWALIVDENYGEGSAREHAALQPRFYGKLLLHKPLLNLVLIFSFTRMWSHPSPFFRPYS